LRAREDPDDKEEEEDLELAVVLGGRVSFKVRFAGVASGLSDEGRPRPLGLGALEDARRPDMVQREKRRREHERRKRD
jgi:hypothetical protein